MRLENYLTEDGILFQLDAPDKWALIDRMVEVCSRSPAVQITRGLTRGDIVKAVLAREKQAPTGIGNGFAFPHARVPGLKGSALCLATLKTPIDYGATDGRKVYVACMVLTPAERPIIALKIMSGLAKLLATPEMEAMFRSATGPADIYRHIADNEVSVSAPIAAGEIMRRPSFIARPEMSLRELIGQMAERNAEAVAVVDRDSKLIGHITCDALFQFGVPEFFSRLKSVSFIEAFDPFERYFEEASRATVERLMSRDPIVVGVDTMLLEIVFLLTTEGHQKIYVVKEGYLVGEIDRAAALDRIINF